MDCDNKAMKRSYKWNEIELHDKILVIFKCCLNLLVNIFKHIWNMYLHTSDFDDYELWCEIWMMMKIRTELN